MREATISEIKKLAKEFEEMVKFLTEISKLIYKRPKK